jgi:hypothetical protein
MRALGEEVTIAGPTQGTERARELCDYSLSQREPVGVALGEPISTFHSDSMKH